jgi:hypothetical protein
LSWVCPYFFHNSCHKMAKETAYFVAASLWKTWESILCGVAVLSKTFIFKFHLYWFLFGEISSELLREWRFESSTIDFFFCTHPECENHPLVDSLFRCRERSKHITCVR